MRGARSASVGRQPVLERVGGLDDVVVDRDHGVAHLPRLGLGQEEIVVRHRPEYARGRPVVPREMPRLGAGPRMDTGATRKRRRRGRAGHCLDVRGSGARHPGGGPPAEPCRHPARPARARRGRRRSRRPAPRRPRRCPGRRSPRRRRARPLGAAPAVAGVTPTGDARAVAVDNSDDLTLLGFLSSGCTGCAAFWDALQDPGRLQLPDRTRVVIVTKGPDREVPAEVRAKDDRPGPGGDVHRRLARLPGTRLPVLRPGRRRHGSQGRAGGGQPRRRSWPSWSGGPSTTGARSTGGRGRGDASLGGPAREAAADEVLAGGRDPPGRPEPVPAHARRRLPLARRRGPVPARSSGHHRRPRHHGTSPGRLRGPDLRAPRHAWA